MMMIVNNGQSNAPGRAINADMPKAWSDKIAYIMDTHCYPTVWDAETKTHVLLTPTREYMMAYNTMVKDYLEKLETYLKWKK